MPAVEPWATGSDPVMPIIGRSPAIQSVLARVGPIARARRTTLISGPTGTGKEIIAQALHREGQPNGTPFVVVHCGALTDTLAEDELFGHARGAFTGARDSRHGLIRAASGGTLFLDEVDSLSSKVQANLLRFLESGEYRSLGSDRLEHAKPWVIAATNRDLAEQVQGGTFRADLWYRLDVIRVDLPPLKLRGQDIELLAEYFLREVAGSAKHFAPSALAALHRHDWPGNVRELRHCVERAALLAESSVIEDTDFGLAGTAAPAPAPPELEDGLWQLVARDGLSLSEAVLRCERAIIAAALRAENGNRTRAADRLRIHLRTIFKKLERGRT